MVFEFQDLNKPMDCLIMRIKKKKSNSNTKVDTELKRFQRKKKTEKKKLRRTSRRKKNEVKNRRVGVRKVFSIVIFIQFINN
jgi:hypothetical protein